MRKVSLLLVSCGLIIGLALPLSILAQVSDPEPMCGNCMFGTNIHISDAFSAQCERFAARGVKVEVVKRCIHDCEYIACIPLN